MDQQGLSDVFRQVRGNLRLIKEHNQLYIIGEGMYLPVWSYEEGVALIKEYERAYERIST